jgi:hypothetical protein
MIEGSGSGSRADLDQYLGTGSERPKNIQNLRIWIQNTAQKRTSSISKQEICSHFYIFCGLVCPAGSGSEAGSALSMRNRKLIRNTGPRSGSGSTSQRYGSGTLPQPLATQQREAGVCGDDPNMMVLVQLRGSHVLSPLTQPYSSNTN